MSEIRQYDIWIDGQKLGADFLADKYTRVGMRLVLGFGDGQVSIRKGIEQFDVSATYPQETLSTHSLINQLLIKRVGSSISIDSQEGWARYEVI